MLVQVWNTNIVHVKEQRWGLQKCRPRGGCGFCVVTGRERTFLPPTASWKPDSPPLLATQHLFVLPTTFFLFLLAWFIRMGILARDSSWQRPFCTEKLYWLLFCGVNFSRGGVTKSSLWLIKHDDFFGIWGAGTRRRFQTTCRSLYIPHIAAAHVTKCSRHWRRREPDRGSAPAVRHWTAQVE